MKYNCKNYIRVLYRQPETASTNSELGISDIEKKQVIAFMETTVSNLLKIKNRTLARQYLKEQAEKSKLLGAKVASGCNDNIRVLSNWIEGKSMYLSS